MVVWVPVLLCMAFIFLFSSQPYAKQDLRPVIRKTIPEGRLTEVAGHVRLNYGGREVSIRELGEAAFAEFFIRKAAHIAEYAILGFLLFMAARRLFNKRTSPWTIGVTVLLCAALFASSDEWHQRFVPDRTPRAADVLLDTCGAAVGILLAARFGRRQLKKRDLT
ncbi:VanZ family protein [Cohnella pontilimi]|uniref:VanZ family protein n=1 Tax=Cohnella pontilimi TaxID=2564100 RepID=A0A4V5LSP1_9BACL|nr:VanZ family protein [Cohnella pontilimi]TJY42749.1 VanZ family protein [Cohnella pontilimi]